MTLQADAAAFVSTLTFDDLPQDAVRVATLGFTDTIAALLAGRVESVTRATEKYLAQTATPGGPVVTRALLGASEYQAEHSALLDAVAAHALDY
ncbi:MAG: MmgE/PrpD family protein, partial [Sulfitobacter geojensis]